MDIGNYTYRITWSEDDQEHIGLCAEFPSLSWLAATPDEALTGIYDVVREVVKDMQDSNEKTPLPIADSEKAEYIPPAAC
jgi:predicted RNase H-like HicB family nuclease